MTATQIKFSSELTTKLQFAIDDKTKPIGALGQVEHLALQIGLIQNTEHPNVDKAAAFVFGGDHGVCAEGVNPFPQVVTEQMLANFAAGGAAMSVFCQANGIAMNVINMGIVNGDVRWPNVQHAAIACGTENFKVKPAMSKQQCQQAMQVGEQLAQKAVNEGYNLLMIGEMGIGNTTSASALLSSLLDIEPSKTVGPGTGANEAQQALKVDVIKVALARAGKLELSVDALAEFGGFEIAAMVGFLIAAAKLRTPVIVDGFISTIAALVAEKDNPGLSQCWVFAHRSAEPAHTEMLTALSAKPLLDLQLRLGEGTGAALAYPILKCAVAMLNNMATFSSAGISES
ncbi:nicotinate-nucleotide--dimethylbenzimidazole phosphoribosyltransferase [Reinekea sp.]|jgi:nicotinate-nucleotide--dimethylbenzimidazole phosphoribosyltransferase|uniref:nicotinate-nucleotide--dimethylbenzimidazole phosphoribosyltransferase n=1 Tax=Reinekea sp. TaxID=1970455 RepID=UPI00398A0B1C